MRYSYWYFNQSWYENVLEMFNYPDDLTLAYLNRCLNYWMDGH